VGDDVERGDPLVEIESDELGKVTAELLSARANLSAAQNQAQREAELGEKQLSTARAVERATAEASALRAEAQGLEQRLRAMGLTEAELSRLAHGTVPRSVTLRAPIAGQVVERFAVLGQVVDPTHPVLRVADLNRLWVELDVFERDLGQVAVGSEVEISREAAPGKVLRGAVTYVDATVDLATRSARVRVEVQNPQRLLRPGEFVLAHLTTQATKRDVIGIPRKAVLRLDGVPSVFLSVGEETYLARPVELGAASGDDVEVIRGLVEGDLIVTEGAFVLKSELER
jgi:cobalt-zinc-cadmium efflux system membrane fusion protein